MRVSNGSFSFEAEGGWMQVLVAPAPSDPSKVELTLQGLHGVRGGKFSQSVELDEDETRRLCVELLAGTSYSVHFRAPVAPKPRGRR
jgi:hypothetical protein